MVTIIASLTTEEIATELGCPDTIVKVIVQRMFGMCFTRPYPDTFNFFKVDQGVANRHVIASAESVYIGLRDGETDGTKAAVLAYIVKAAPSHMDMRGWSKKVVEPPPVP